MRLTWPLHSIPLALPQLLFGYFTLRNPASSEYIPCSTPTPVWGFILYSLCPSSPKWVSASVPILVWTFTRAKSGFSRIVFTIAIQHWLDIFNLLLNMYVHANLGAIRISYRLCNSRRMRTWPNNVTASDGSWSTRNDIASGDSNLTSSERSEGQGGPYFPV